MAWIRAIVLLPLALFAVLNWWKTIRDVVRFFVPSPVWDYFLTLDHYARYQRFDLSVLWIPHNEHRIVFPELIFAADSLWFHGRTVLPLVVSFLCYFGIWAVIGYALFANRDVPALPRYCAILLSGAMMAWLGAAYPLSSPILLQWTLNQFAAIVALVFLRTRSLAFVGAAAVVCTYSSGNGLLIWPLLLAIAVLIGHRRKYLVSLAAQGAVFTGVYFVGYHSDSTIAWSRPPDLAKFLASLLSMPFGLLRSEPEFGIRIGLYSFAVLGLLLIAGWRLIPTRTGTVLFGYLFFVMASGILIAAGRPFADSRAVRFLALPLTYWAVLAAIAIWVLARIPKAGTILAVTVSLAACLLLHRLTDKLGYKALDGAFAEGYATQQWAALSLESQINDPVTNAILHPDAATTQRLLPVMQAQHLAVFSYPAPPTTQGGTPINGGIITSRRLATTVAFAGWADTDEPIEVVLMDENGKRVGIGRSLSAGAPRAFRYISIPRGHAWFAFVNLQYASHTVTPWLVSADRKSLRPFPDSAHFSVDLH